MRIAVFARHANPSVDKPNQRIGRRRALLLIEEGFAEYVSEFSIQMTSKEPIDQTLKLVGGTMRDSWAIKDSGGYPTWQMPSFRRPNSGVPELA